MFAVAIIGPFAGHWIATDDIEDGEDPWPPKYIGLEVVSTCRDWAVLNIPYIVVTSSLNDRVTGLRNVVDGVKPSVQCGTLLAARRTLWRVLDRQHGDAHFGPVANHPASSKQLIIVEDLKELRAAQQARVNRKRLARLSRLSDDPDGPAPDELRHHRRRQHGKPQRSH